MYICVYMDIAENIVKLGGGAHSLVVIPGLSTTRLTGDPGLLANSFRPFLEEYTLYFVDRRDEIPENCSSRVLAVQAYEDLTAAGVSRAAVIGVSQGGMIAQFLAADHPEMVEKLVLAATLAGPNDMMKDSFTTWISLAERKDYQGLNHDMFSRIYSSGFYERNLRALSYAEKTMRPDDDLKFIRLTRACLNHDSRDVLKNITCPVLVAGGGLDRVLSFKASEELAASLGCPLLSFEDFGHAFYDETPDFYRKAYEFLR